MIQELVNSGQQEDRNNTLQHFLEKRKEQKEFQSLGKEEHEIKNTIS
jgi:hypothetical protein